MRRLSRLARRTVHLLLLESLLLAVLVFPLQLSSEGLTSLRRWTARPGFAGAVQGLGLNPTSVGAFDIEAVVNSGFEPLVLKENLAKVAVILALIAWAISRLTRAPLPGSGGLRRARLIWLVAAVGVLTLSLLLGTSGGRRMVWLQSRSYFTALAGLAFLMMLADAMRTRRVALKWIAALYVLTLPVMVISLLQHLGDVTLPPDRFQWLGVIPLPRGAEHMRNTIGSLIGHNVGVALTMTPGLLFAPALWRRAQRPWIRASLAVWVVGALWVLVRSQSRSVYLSLVIGLGAWFLISRLWLRRESERSLLSPTARRWLLVGAVVFLLVQFVPNPLRGSQGLGSRLRRLIDAEELMTDTRMRTLVCGLPAFLDSPLAGWGIGSFPTVYPEYQGRFFSDERNWDTGLHATGLITQRAHNDWLQLGIEMGVLGIAVVLWGLILWWGRGWRCLRRGRPMDPGLLSAALALGLVFACQAAFDFPMHVTPTALMALVIAVLAGNAPEIFGPRRRVAWSAPPHPALRWLAVAVILVWCLWPPHVWVGRQIPASGGGTAPTLARVLRPPVAEVMADAHHVAAMAHMELYYRNRGELRGTQQAAQILGEARARLRDALLLTPASGPIRARMGEVLTHLGPQSPHLYTAALDQFQIALSEVNNYTVPYYMAECHHGLSLHHSALAADAEERGDADRAEREREEAQRHWSLAEDHYWLALDLNPSDPYSADALIRMLTQRGRDDEAISVLRLERRWSTSWYQRRWVGRTLTEINLGILDRALERLALLRRVEPDEPLYWAVTAECHIRARDAESARDAITELQSRFPEADAYDYLEAQVLVIEGDLEGATARAREIDEQSGSIHMLCLVHLAQRGLGRMDEASATYREIEARMEAEGRPVAAALDILANMAWDLFDDREVAEQFYRAIAQDPPGPRTLLYHRLALRAHERGDDEQARFYLSLLPTRLTYEPVRDLREELAMEDRPQ